MFEPYIMPTIPPSGFLQAKQDLPYAEHYFGTKKESGADVESTIRRYTERMGPIAHMRQVHGDRIAYASGPGIYEETDGLYTDHADLWLAVKTADCLPILISTPAAVAVVHAGWRGLKSEVLPKMINTLMDEFEESPAQIYLHIGPSISVDHYEVEDTFTREFDEKFFKPAKKKGKLMLDLAAVARSQAMEAGIPDLNIHNTGLCTFEKKDLFYSYRRDKGAENGQYQVQFALVRHRRPE